MHKTWFLRARQARLEKTKFLLSQKKKNNVSSKISCAYVTEELTTQLLSYYTFISFFKFYKLTLSKTRQTVNIINNFLKKNCSGSGL